MCVLFFRFSTTRYTRCFSLFIGFVFSHSLAPPSWIRRLCICGAQSFDILCVFRVLTVHLCAACQSFMEGRRRCHIFICDCNNIHILVIIIAQSRAEQCRVEYMLKGNFYGRCFLFVGLLILLCHKTASDCKWCEFMCQFDAGETCWIDVASIYSNYVL